MIRKIFEADAGEICRIYNHFVRDTVVTFEEVEVEAEEMVSRIRKITQKFPWYVYEDSGVISGYAYASSWRDRSAYRYSVEGTIYLDPLVTGRGIGTPLYEKLINTLREQGIHSIIGSIALPNPASIALHEKLGFSKAAQFKETGWKQERWIDVGYWQLIL